MGTDYIDYKRSLVFWVTEKNRRLWNPDDQSVFIGWVCDAGKIKLTSGFGGGLLC